MIEAYDLSSATLVKVQQCSCGGPGKTPVAFEVKYYLFPGGRFALVTKPDDLLPESALGLR